MKLLCLALNLWALNFVGGFQAPTRIHSASRRALTPPWSCHGIQRPPSTLSRERLSRERLFSMKVEEADPDRYGRALATTAVVTVGASLFGLGEQQGVSSVHSSCFSCGIQDLCFRPTPCIPSNDSYIYSSIPRVHWYVCFPRLRLLDLVFYSNPLNPSAWCWDKYVSHWQQPKQRVGDTQTRCSLKNARREDPLRQTRRVNRTAFKMAQVVAEKNPVVFLSYTAKRCG